MPRIVMTLRTIRFESTGDCAPVRSERQHDLGRNQDSPSIATYTIDQAKLMHHVDRNMEKQCCHGMELHKIARLDRQLLREWL